MAFTDPTYMVWFLIEEHPSVIHTSHVPLVCVPCEPDGSALIALDFRKRTIEKIVNLGGNHICFRESLSQTFNLVRLDFPSMSPKFPFFLVIPTQPSIRTHRWCAEGSAEAPGSKVLPLWTLNLRVYSKTHVHRQKRCRTKHTSINTQHGFTCVLLCFIKPILGNCYGPGVSSRANQGIRTHD